MDKEYRVSFASNEHYILDGCLNAVISGSLRFKNDTLPVTGDMVKAHQSGETCLITEICPRKTELKRSASNPQGFQVLAANATHLMIVMAMDSNFSIRRLDRFLILAKSAGIIPVTVLTKADLCDPAKSAVMEYEVSDACMGGKVFVTSSRTNEGIEELSSYFAPSDIVCLAGLSGAGKSTLLNLLCGEEVTTTSEVRIRDSKGKHTTTARQMYRASGGYYIIDTPGIREVGVTGDTESVDEVFSDISELSLMCRFPDCTHDHEPGCAVIRAVEEGRLNPDRLKSYLKVMTEAQVKREASERKQKEKNLSKLVKQLKNIKKR